VLRFFAVLFPVVLLDQLSKYWIVSNFTPGESQVVIRGFFDLTYLHNTGAAFGLLAGQPSVMRQVFFVGIALVALAVLLIFHHRMQKQSVWFTLAFGLIGGGAVGNLIDRLHYGSVVDFLDFYIGSHHWPAFNVADSAICVGVGLFIVTSYLLDRRAAMQAH
jgi:signal peptidase II